MALEINYKTIAMSRKKECSNQNIVLYPLQMKMLQQVELRSLAKHSTRLSSLLGLQRCMILSRP
jgi:hypothetical protein